jgi:hypothetical protein
MMPGMRLRASRWGLRGAVSALSIAIALAIVLAILGAASCDGCLRGRHGSTLMCGTCVQSAECAWPLACVNGFCETAPPSCHRNIGL